MSSTSASDASVKSVISVPPRRPAPTVPAPATFTSPRGKRPPSMPPSPATAVTASATSPATPPATMPEATMTSPPTEAPSATPTAPPDCWSPTSTICPPELQCLMHLDQLFVDQVFDKLEALTNWQVEKKYNVVDSKGAHVFGVYEDSSDLARICLGRYRFCDFKVVDANMREVLRVSRPLKCESCCCSCCLQEVSVLCNGIILGSIIQNWNLWRYSFSICNEIGETVLRLKGPILWCSFQNDFEIISVDERHRIGVISRKCMRFAPQPFQHKEVFGVNFPQNLDVKIKAVLVAACFLIDLMQCEENSRLKRLDQNG